MATNLLCDHRISPQRLRSFGASNSFLDFEQVNDAVCRHKNLEVCPSKASQKLPAYVREENNLNTILPGPDIELATVLNLSRLGRAFRAARETFRIAEFSRFEMNSEKTSEVTDQLSKHFAFPQNRTAFLGAILEARNRYQNSDDDKYLHLTWAAEWSSLQKFLDGNDPRRWLQAVGVAAEEPVWVAVLRYRAFASSDRPLALFRPTQLDAGWYAYHFPSPPQRLLEDGGCTMFLSDQGQQNPAANLVSEYIHQSVDFTVDHWQAAGGFLGLIEQPVGSDLVGNREEHVRSLTQQFGNRVREWLDLCN